MLDLTLLGSGGSMPTPHRFLSSLIIEYKGRKILIDCGEGTQVAMKKFNTGFKSLDIICITHFHGDHIYGLPGLLATLGNSNRTEPITIIGPQFIKNIIEHIIIPITYVPFDIYVIENPASKLEIVNTQEGLRVKDYGENLISEIELSTIELDHSDPCLGYSFALNRNPKFILEKALNNKVPRELWKPLQLGQSIEFEGREYKPEMVLGDKRKGIKLSFITDSRPNDKIVEFIRDSDLFICEGTYGDDGDANKALENKHMIFKESAKLASDGNVGTLLLTHFSQSMESPMDYLHNANSIFRETIIGYDGWKKILSFEN